MRKKIIFIILFIVLSLNTLNSQVLTNYNSSNSGLINDNINSIAVDKMGIKWIATNGGISQFDGINWTNYDTLNNYALKKEALSIVIDGNNNKWIGTNGKGLIKFDGVNWTNYDSTNSGLPYNYITSVYADSKGIIWVGANGASNHNHSITSFNGTNWYNNNCYTHIFDIAETHEHYSLWFTSDFNALNYDGNNWTDYFFNPTNTGYYISRMVVDLSNNVWITSNNNVGICNFNGNNWHNFEDSTNVINIYNNARVPIVDEFNNKWFLSWNYSGSVMSTLLIKVKDTIWTFDTISNNIPVHQIFARAIDSIGNKWYGSPSGFGLWKLDCFIPTTPTTIIGTQYVYKGQNSVTYYVPPIDYASSYIWTFPNGFVGTSTTNYITVNVGNNAVSGTIKVYGHSNCGNGNPTTINVTITPMGIDEESQTNTYLNITPNPTKDNLTIETNSNTKQGFEIVNLLGQTLYTSIIYSKATIDVSSFPKGVYILKLNTDKGIVVKKFIKE